MGYTEVSEPTATYAERSKVSTAYIEPIENWGYTYVGLQNFTYNELEAAIYIALEGVTYTE